MSLSQSLGRYTLPVLVDMIIQTYQEIHIGSQQQRKISNDYVTEFRSINLAKFQALQEVLVT